MTHDVKHTQVNRDAGDFFVGKNFLPKDDPRWWTAGFIGQGPHFSCFLNQKTIF